MNQGRDGGQAEERTHKWVVLFKNVVCKGEVREQSGTSFREPPNASIRERLSVFYKRMPD